LLFLAPAPVLDCGSKNNDFAVNDFAKMECRETRVQGRESFNQLPGLVQNFSALSGIFEQIDKAYFFEMGIGCSHFADTKFSHASK
jgi:hypothetical protein